MINLQIKYLVKLDRKMLNMNKRRSYDVIS